MPSHGGVAMAQAAHVGIGIEGSEGRHAALAADFSIRQAATLCSRGCDLAQQEAAPLGVTTSPPRQFSHLRRLVLWHGRNCHIRSATLSQFVIHRGLIISVIQARARVHARRRVHTHGTCAQHVCALPIWAHPNLGASQSGRISLSRQAVFSALFYFAPIPLYNGVLVVGYATLFTTGPVFSLVLDEDVSESNALKFPQLYRELQVEARG